MKELPWVDRCSHLGNTLTSDGQMSQDCKEKRASFIDGSVKIREMFNFAHPSEIITAIEKYCSSWYGSNVWRFESASVESILASWRTCIKLTWNIPRSCHNYFVDYVLAMHSPPLLCSLLSRFHKFFLSLLESDSSQVSVIARLAARDVRSNLGSNLRLLKETSGLDPWCTGTVAMKERLAESCLREIPPEDLWRVPYLEKLLSARQWAHYNTEEDIEKELSAIIDSLVTN